MSFRNPLKERALAVRNRARTLLSGWTLCPRWAVCVFYSLYPCVRS